MEALPGKREEVKAAYASASPIFRKESGCQEFEVFESIEHPGHYVMMERWANQAALDGHRNSMDAKGLLVKFAQLRRLTYRERMEAGSIE